MTGRERERAREREGGREREGESKQAEWEDLGICGYGSRGGD